MGKKTWADDDLATLMHLRDVERLDWDGIAARIGNGKTAAACAARYDYEGVREIRSRVSQAAPPPRARPSAKALAERDARLAGYERRNQTQTFFGDPPVGFSAADQGRGR